MNSYQQEHLLQSSDGPTIPVGVIVSSVGVASNQMFGQNHDETLEDDQEQSFLVDIGRLQLLFHLLNDFFCGTITRFDPSAFRCFIIRIARFRFGFGQFLFCFDELLIY